MDDAVDPAKSGQKVPEGHYDLQTTLQNVMCNATDNVGVCASCMDARGMQVSELVELGTLEEVTDWFEWVDKAFVL